MMTGREANGFLSSPDHTGQPLGVAGSAPGSARAFPRMLEAVRLVYERQTGRRARSAEGRHRGALAARIEAFGGNASPRIYAP